MEFGLSSVISMIGAAVSGSPENNIFDSIISASATLCGNNSSSGRSIKSDITAATVGMVSAYTSSDFNTYTSYVNKCYAEVEEPVAELSSFSPEIRDVANVMKIMTRGTPEQKQKAEEEQQLLKSLQEARLTFLCLYFPDLSEEEIQSIARFYFEPVTKKNVETKPQKSQVSSSAANGFTSTEFGNSVAETIKPLADKFSNFNLAVVSSALRDKGIEIGGTKAYELADFIAKSDKYVECTDSKPEQLAKLPAGAVVIWGSDEEHLYGRASIALGDGNEAAESIRPQLDKFSKSYRLFLPL